jgi:hypothetical protein
MVVVPSVGHADLVRPVALERVPAAKVIQDTINGFM